MREITDAIWTELLAEAKRVMQLAYVPYSKYPVGAAALTESGAIVSGCNVENASYGLTLCAECGLVSALAMQGGGKIVAFACVDGDGNSLTPCGRCRQLLYEHGGPELLIWDNGRVITMNELLPGAFGPDFLK